MIATSYRFGEFELHPERFELRCRNHPLRLERKPMELLILLATAGGRVLTRTEIAERLWGPDVFVDAEHGINTAVRKLRQALGDDPEKPQYIQTILKTGYCFLAPVSAIGESVCSPAPVSIPDIPDNAETALPVAPLLTAPRRWRSLPVLGAAAAFLLVAAVAGVTFLHRSSPPDVRYEQLTDLTDTAVAPAISPDGHTVAFIRGSSVDQRNSGFASTGPVYIKSLPDGEERPVSNDVRPKYGLAFSPDASQIAYTVFDKEALATYIVSVFGGEPRLLRNNAAGLTWLGDDQVLFSETRSGIHLGVVQGSLHDDATRDVYFPPHQRGMAHYAQASPDRKWALVVEMDGTGNWAPCRLVALVEHPRTRTVGPGGACTAGAWSTDGRWMYFTATVAGQSHIWRQRFPGGQPQQITFGMGEEEGLAVEGAGNSLITSIGAAQSVLWIHDDAGERALSSQGEILTGSSPPLFRRKATVLYYLLRRNAGQSAAELWRAELGTGRKEAVISGVPMLDFDVSSDGDQVVFSTKTGEERELWLAPTDRSRPPVRLGVRGVNYPHFTAGGNVLFQSAEAGSNYLEEVALNGQGRRKILASPISQLEGVSPGGHWAMAVVSESSSSTHPAVVAIPVDGSASRRICDTYCTTSWAPDGRSLVIPLESSSIGDRGRSVVVPIGPNESIPGDGPGTGSVLTSRLSIKGGPKLSAGADRIPGMDENHYALVRTAVQRNLFRVRLR